jgi:hypothetical protein
VGKLDIPPQKKNNKFT